MNFYLIIELRIFILELSWIQKTLKVFILFLRMLNKSQKISTIGQRIDSQQVLTGNNKRII
jgi:hypothetical protein